MGNRLRDGLTSSHTTAVRPDLNHPKFSPDRGGTRARINLKPSDFYPLKHFSLSSRKNTCSAQRLGYPQFFHFYVNSTAQQLVTCYANTVAGKILLGTVLRRHAGIGR